MSSSAATSSLSPSLKANPRLSRWLRFKPAGFVEVTPGKVEIGQGILTALAQIVADELDLELAQVRILAANTAESPNEGVTSGSLSVQHCGSALRQVSAEARAIYLAAAAARLGVAATSLQVSAGKISSRLGAATSYWELADDALLECNASGNAAPKQASQRQVAGRTAARLDLPDKVFAHKRFIHDLCLTGMLHGRILRPTSPGARLTHLNPIAAEKLPGVIAIIRDGDFVGVVADTEAAAETAVELLRASAEWQQGEALPDQNRLAAWLKQQPVETTPVDVRGSETSGIVKRTLRRSFTKPFIAHASLGPACAIAEWREDGVQVQSHTQGVFNLRADLAKALSLSPERVVVSHVEGAGCYGHNAADDVALDAALLARAVKGRPVRVQWSREDELAWAPFGAAMAVEIEADLDADGDVVGWRHDVWSNGHTSRPGRGEIPTLLAASHIADGFPQPLAQNVPLANGGGAERNAVPPYDFPAWRIASHRLTTMPIRTSALRSLGAFANVFAIESCVDEIAASRDEDAVSFRLRHMQDPRARAVVQAAAGRAAWTGQRKQDGIGQGIGYARYKTTGAYCAVVAEVEIDRDVRVNRLIIAVDVGEVINPDGVINQIEGGAIQATSWTLKEAVRFDRTRITSATWDEYPILRFSEVPAVEVEIIARPEEPAVGAGEAAHGPTAAAIGNAVFRALGVRVTELPITSERILAQMP
jgi:CO/xanthine dehydrogenase Mo-binding subunit